MAIDCTTNMNTFFCLIYLWLKYRHNFSFLVKDHWCWAWTSVWELDEWPLSNNKYCKPLRPMCQPNQNLVKKIIDVKHEQVFES